MFSLEAVVSSAEFPVLSGATCLVLSSLTSSNMEDDPCSRRTAATVQINPPTEEEEKPAGAGCDLIAV